MVEIEPHDAWIFLAIARSDGAEWADFLGVADHINVGTPTNEEIEGAVRRLVSCAWIRVDGNRFHLTSEGRRAFTNVGALEAFPRPQVAPCQRLLEARGAEVELACDWKLDVAAMKQAKHDYSKRMARVAQQHRRPKA
ncbi:MAG: hypothetical protein ABL998_03855 [Planctomycetota bacterium]